MPLIDLLHRQLGDGRRGPANGRPDLAKCLVVSGIAAVSPAGVAGVAKGDLVVSIDGKPAVETEADVRPVETGRHAWRIRSLARGDEVVIETHLPLGVRLRPTAEAIEATHGATSDHDRLVELWEAGEWGALERVASRTFQKKQGMGFRLAAKALGGSTDHDPTRVLLGAALYELGRREEGLAHVREYVEHHERYWTTNFMAVGRYVLGREALRTGDREEGVTLLGAAFQYHDESGRIARAVEEATGKRPTPERAHQGKALPVDYRLPVIVGEGAEAWFSRTLGRMKPGQLLTVCTLGSYRGNGPYNEFMDRYHWYTETLGSRLHELHVITSNAKKEAHADWWFNAEERARKAGVKFSILWDEEEDVSIELFVSKSPWIFVVDRTGLVVHEGRMDEVDVWDALVAADEEAAPALPSAARAAPRAAGEAESAGRGEPPAASCLAVAVLLAVTVGGGAAGWLLWRWVGLIGGAAVAGFLALLIYGIMLPPGPDEKS